MTQSSEVPGFCSWDKSLCIQSITDQGSLKEVLLKNKETKEQKLGAREIA